MTIRTIDQLKADMPLAVAGSIIGQDFHNIIDTFDDRASQSIITTNASYTATAADSHRRIVFNSATAVVLTLPNSLPAGWEAVVIQWGTGAVTITAATGGARFSRSGHTRIAGRYGAAYLLVVSNAGTAAQILMTGDTAA